MACRRYFILVMVAFFVLAPAAGLATTIYDVQHNDTNQGTGDDCFPSSFDGQQVTVEGIVTAVRAGDYPNFWLEEADGGLWKGIYVYDVTVEPSRGDQVSITAEVDDYFGLTELKNVTSFQIISSGNTLPTVMDITTGVLAGGCNVGAEAYEGVLVRVSNAVVTQEVIEHGEWYVDDGSGQCQIDDYLYAHSPALGDTLETIVGVVQYGYGEYEINPRDADDVVGGAPPDTAQTIYDVQYNETNQGTGDDCYPSPYGGQSVTIEGVVTALLSGDYPDFWMQTADKGLWSGVFVYDTSVEPTRGDLVTITATPDEYYGLTEMKSVSDFTIHSSGNPLPALLDISTADLAGGCNASSEAYEGMLVRVLGVVVTQEVDEHGQWFIDDGSGACEVDDYIYHHEPALGDTFAAIIGVVHYSYGEYEILPRDGSDIQTELTSVESSGDAATLPGCYALCQNYPNPFNPQTEIRYTLPERAYVRLQVYNLLGQRVASLADGIHQPGEFSVRWDSTDDAGVFLASGIYFCRLQAGEFSAVKKMIYLK
jgi:predicted extracellular nuclease